MAAPSTSPRDTAALVGLGLVAVGESGVRATRAAWGSTLLRPARWLAAPAVNALVRRGFYEQQRLRALAPGGVTELAVGVAVDHALVERTVAELLRRGVFEDVADQIGTSALPLHVVEDTFADGPAFDRLLDEFTDRLLASEQLQRVVAHIARSPEVRDALSAQSAGMADEVAGAVRTRSAAADDVAERLARRLLHRRPALPPDGLASEPG